MKTDDDDENEDNEETGQDNLDGEVANATNLSLKSQRVWWIGEAGRKSPSSTGSGGSETPGDVQDIHGKEGVVRDLGQPQGVQSGGGVGCCTGCHGEKLHGAGGKEVGTTELGKLRNSHSD